VTNKLRRVSNFSLETVKEALLLNGGHEMWLTFLNYEFPELWGSADAAWAAHIAMDYLFDLEEQLCAPIVGVTTGPESEHHLWIK
jgi:adenylosuccinate synthase